MRDPEVISEVVCHEAERKLDQRRKLTGARLRDDGRGRQQGECSGRVHPRVSLNVEEPRKQEEESGAATPVSCAQARGALRFNSVRKVGPRPRPRRGSGDPSQAFHAVHLARS